MKYSSAYRFGSFIVTLVMSKISFITFYFQIQNLVKELSDELLSMTNQRLKPLLKDLIDVKNESSITNLQYASKYGHAEQVRILLKVGADFNLKNVENQNSLHFTLNVTQ